MKSIEVLFQGILFLVEYEYEDDSPYAASCMMDGQDWLDYFTQKGKDKMNEELLLEIERQEKDNEMERKLDNYSSKED